MPGRLRRDSVYGRRADPPFLPPPQRRGPPRQDRRHPRLPPPHLPRARRRGATVGRRAPLGGRGAGRPRGVPAAQRARDGRRALRGAAGGRGARRHQHPVGRRGDPLHLRPRRGRRPRGRRRVRGPRHAPARDARHGADGRHGRRRRGPADGRRAPRHRRLPRAARRGGARRIRLVGRRRAGADRDQLHVGHHRPSQGRGLHPPRRLPRLPRRAGPRRAQLRERLPVDAADVPLQRLVHGVGRHGRGRHPGVPARRARRADLAADRRPRRHPSQRRPDRRHHDHERGDTPAGSTGRW